MRVWVLSIIGTVILITLAELILPSGRMKNVTRGIFGFIVMIVILKPLPGLRNAEFNFDFNVGQNTVFLDNINARKIIAMESDGAAYLNVCGAGECTVKINGLWTDGKLDIESVAVTVLSAAVTVTAKEKAAAYYNVKSEAVTVHVKNAE